MDPQLVETLTKISPWLAGGVLLYLSRKEILAAVESFKADSKVEGLLSEMKALFAEMNRQFATNMEMLHVTNSHIAAMHELMQQSLKVQTDMLMAMIRGQK